MKTCGKQNNNRKKGPRRIVVESDTPLVDLARLMQTVKLDAPGAELNKYSVSDGKGGRVFF